MSCSWQNFVGVHDALRIQYPLDLPHDADHLLALRVAEIFLFRYSHSMLRRDATFRVSHELHDERVDDLVQSLLETRVLKAWADDCEVQISIRQMAVSSSIDRFSFLLAQTRCLAHHFSRLFDYSVVILRFETEVVYEAVATVEVGRGSLLSDHPDLVELLLILRDNSVCD